MTKKAKKIEAAKTEAAKTEDTTLDSMAIISNLIDDAMAHRARTTDKGTKTIGNASRETGNIFRQILGQSASDLAEKLLPYSESGKELATMRPFLLGCKAGLERREPMIPKAILANKLETAEQEIARLRAELLAAKA